VLLLVGGFFSLVFWLIGRPSRVGPAPRARRRPGLVIAPDGLALVQGDLSGELGWEELRDVKLMQRAGPNGTAPAVVLHVKGAIITIADVYDRPVALIHQQICHYWRGQSAGDGREWGSAARRLSETVTRPTEDGASPQPSERIMPPE